MPKFPLGFRSAVAACALVCGSMALAQDPGAPTGAPRYGSSRYFIQSFNSTIYASYNNGNVGYLNILLPEGYDAPENAAKEYNILFTLDGNQSDLFNGPMEELVRKGLIDPVIIVGLPTPQGSREYNFAIDVCRFADFVADEVLLYMRSNFRVKAGSRAVAIAGHSLGGVGAFATAWYRYDKIGGCASHSGTLSTSYHWGYRYYTNSAYWNQFDQRPMGDTTWASSAVTGATCVDIRYWAANDNSLGGRKASLRLFLECGTSESNNTASDADSAGDAAAVAHSLLQEGWGFGENLAYYNSNNYLYNNTAHFYTKMEQAAWSSLLFLYRKADLVLTSAQIVPKNQVNYIASSALGNGKGHMAVANRLDMRRSATLGVELRARFGPYCQLSFPDWSSLTIDDTSVASISGLDHVFFQKRPWSMSTAEAYYPNWGKITAGASDGQTMIRGAITYKGTAYPVSCGLNVYNTTVPATPAVGEAGGPRGGANRIPIVQRSALVVPSHAAVASALPGADPDNDALTFRSGSSLYQHFDENVAYEVAGGTHLGHLNFSDTATGSVNVHPFDTTGRAPFIYVADDGGLESYPSTVVVHFGHPRTSLSSVAQAAFSMTVGYAGQSAPMHHTRTLLNGEVANPIDGDAMAPFIVAKPAWATAEILGTSAPYTVRVGVEASAANALAVGNYEDTVTVSPGKKAVLLPEADTFMDANPQGYSVSFLSKNPAQYLMRWNLGSVSGPVKKAILRVYGRLYDTQNVNVKSLADDSWDPNTIKTGNYTPAGGSSLGTMMATDGYAWHSVDVTAYVESQRADGAAGFLLEKPAGTGNSIVYLSEDWNYSPELILVYEAEAPSTCQQEIPVALSVGGLVPEITTASLPQAVRMTPYSIALQASGGLGAKSWTVTSGQMPPGITLTPEGVLSGTPGHEGTYGFSVQVTDSNSPAASDSRSLVLVVGTNTRTVLFDFGTSSTSGHWNNITTSAAGSKVANAIDNAGVATAMTLTFDKAMQGNAVGQSGGVTYPASAMTDGHYITGTQSPLTVTLGGLDPNLLYDLRVFGSTQNTGAATRNSAYTVGGTTQTLVAAQNADATVTFTGVAPVAGSIGLAVSLAPGATYAYLNVLEVTSRLPDGPSITSQPAGSTIESGASASLQVAASGANLTYQWYLGGPGDVSNPISGATSATFVTPSLTQPTSYWVRVGNAGGFDDSATALITIANSGYAGWAANKGLAGGDSAPDADPDGNGVVNLLEYAFAISSPADVANNLPAATSADVSGESHFAIEYTRATNASDLTIIPEFSTDLATWHSGVGYLTTVSTLDNGDGTETITVRANATADETPRTFLRLRVVQSNP